MTLMSRLRKAAAALMIAGVGATGTVIAVAAAPAAQAASYTHTGTFKNLPPLSYRGAWRVVDKQTGKTAKINAQGRWKMKLPNKSAAFNITDGFSGVDRVTCLTTLSKKYKPCISPTSLYGQNKSDFFAEIYGTWSTRVHLTVGAKKKFSLIIANAPETYGVGAKKKFSLITANTPETYAIAPLYTVNGKMTRSEDAVKSARIAISMARVLVLDNVMSVGYTLPKKFSRSDVAVDLYEATDSRSETRHRMTPGRLLKIPYNGNAKTVRYRYSVRGVMANAKTFKPKSGKRKTVTLPLGQLTKGGNVKGFTLSATSSSKASGIIVAPGYYPPGTYKGIVTYRDGKAAVKSVKVVANKKVTVK